MQFFKNFISYMNSPLHCSHIHAWLGSAFCAALAALAAMAFTIVILEPKLAVNVPVPVCTEAKPDLTVPQPGESKVPTTTKKNGQR